MNYYNEFDEKTAAWLRELINQKLIPQGYVDTRSITEVTPSDLKGFTQCHFFAGIGGWSLALQLAGWPEDRPVWTGSCPCQPFSTAGKGLAQADERHLWPVFFNLIKECRPEHVFGEQVASAIGKHWLDGVSSDLESEGYSCGATVLGAHSVGAPHIRQRLYWLAHSNNKRLEGRSFCGDSRGERTSGESGVDSGLADAKHLQCEGGISIPRIVCGPEGIREAAEFTGCGEVDWTDSGRLGDTNSQQADTTVEGQPLSGEGLFRCWDASRFIECIDGKTRRIPAEPAFFPLANGVSSARVGILRGAGNAIVPQVAAEFVGAYLDCLQEDWI